MFLNVEMKHFAFPFFIATLLVLLSLWFQARVGLSLQDEGFLWYGTQQTFKGAVPLLDFMAYDPGRYYWCALFMWVMQDSGIVTLRIAEAIFQWMGLCIALCAVYRYENRKWLVVVAGMLLMLWMFPRHKLFDHTLALALTITAAWLIELPDRKRYFLAGLILGIVAIFGRNHGVYGAVGLGGASLLNFLTRRGPDVAAAGPRFLAGLALGYAPLILMLISVPGFFNSFKESIRFLFEIKATNLTLPVPWPWAILTTGKPLIVMTREIVTGGFFVALLAFPVVGAFVLFQRRHLSSGTSPLLTAAVLLTVPYAHYAFSRADVQHLAQGIGPMMLGLVALHSNQAAGKRLVFIIFMFCLVALSFLAVRQRHSGYAALSAGNWGRVDIAGDALLLDHDTAIIIHTARRIMAENHRTGEGVLITPFWPGLYPTLGLSAPGWEIYALWPRTESFQDSEIDRIQASNTRMVILSDIALDGREELRFKFTHAKIYDYICRNYRPLAVENAPESLKFFKR